MRERLLQRLVPLVLQVEIEREAVRLADVSGEDRFHVYGTSTTKHEVTKRFDAFVLFVLRGSSSCFVRRRGDNRSARPRRASRRSSSSSRRILRPQALVPGVVDHHDRRAIARAEALDLDAA